MNPEHGSPAPQGRDSRGRLSPHYLGTERLTLSLSATERGKAQLTAERVADIKCSFLTSIAVNSATNDAGAAALSTLARPPASSLSTRHITPTTSYPNCRAASIACTVDDPVVHTSSTITTRAPFSRKPSILWPVPCCFSALRTRNP